MPTKRQLEEKVSMLNDALEASLAASPIRDDNFFPTGLSDLYTNRGNYDRKRVFSESLRAWRVNPLARRIVELATSFVIGKGIAIKSDNPETQAFLDEWWQRNRLTRNTKRWKDEDARTGNLFILYNVLADGMTILRAVPAENIDDIVTDPDDVERETGYWKDEGHIEKWDAYKAGAEQNLFMMHFASNQPVGNPWGEPKLAPLLVWIGRYSSWLESRVRLNTFRTAFMYVVRGKYKSESERAARQLAINANPPKPGSVLVMNSDSGEEWGILSANLDSFDASVDGLTIKKMISDGAGQPLHWHAEPEGATQTTAEAAGTPTFRTLEDEQREYFDNIVELARVACEIRRLKPATIWVEGPDITERDNATLALALGRGYPYFADMFDRDAIEPKEFMRLVYKLIAEVWDETKIPKIKKKPLVKPGEQASAAESDSKTDPSDPKESE